MIFKKILPIKKAKFTAVACVCYSPADEIVLLKKRSNHPLYPGLYGFVAGRVLEGELPEEAVIREIKEETGNDVLPEDLEPFISLSSKHKTSKGKLDFICQNFYLKTPLGRIRISKKEHESFLFASERDVLVHSKKEFVPDAQETFRLFYEMKYGNLKVGQKVECLGGAKLFRAMTGIVAEVSSSGTEVKILDQDGRDSWWGREFVRPIF